MRGLTSAVCILICAMLASGCGGAATVATGTAPQDTITSLADFPQPSRVLRIPSSTVSERYATGSQASAALPQQRFATDGVTGIFSPAWTGAGSTLADAAYTGYVFELPDYEGPWDLHLVWDAPPAAEDLWLGLGSFDEDCWKWFNPADPGLHNIANPIAYFSPGGTLMLMLVVLGESGASLAYIGMGEPPGLWHVNADAPEGGDGLSWDTAFTDLQDALAVARAQDEVWVAAGSYYPGSNVYSSFVIGDSVSVYGGFAGTETERSQRDWEANPTILSGGGPTPCHIVTTGAYSLLDGFTVFGGKASGQWDDQRVGGGVLAKFAPVNISNCSFEYNHADLAGGAICFDFGWSTEQSQVTDCSFSGNYTNPPGAGGAICCLSIGSLAIERCSFTGNSAEQAGAVNVVTSFGVDIADCTFSANEATQCGAMYWKSGSGSLTGCTFSGNTADWIGGAIYSRETYLDVRDCLFEDNVCKYSIGGAVNTNLMSDFAGCTFVRNHAMDGGALATSGSDTVLVNCRFLGNTAQDEGGAIYAYASAWPVFLNCLFVGNTAGTAGGGIYAKGESDFQLVSSTLTANTAGQGGALYSDNSRPWIANSVFFANRGVAQGPEVFASGSYTPSFHCCDIAGSGGSGDGWDYDLGHDRDGNIDAPPLFVTQPDPGPDLEWGTADDDYGQLWLGAGSPCIDAGDNSDMTAYGVDYDLARLARFIDDLLTEDTGYGDPPLIDIGAFEFQ